MSSKNNQRTPLDDAERVRLKRLARLGGSSTSPGPSPSPTPVTPQPISPKPSPQPAPQPKPVATPVTPVPVASTSQVIPVKKVPVGPVKLDQETWEHETIGHVLRVTLDRNYAESHGWEPVWLKYLREEFESEQNGVLVSDRLSADIIDRLVIARLDIDPQKMEDDLDYLPVLASLPENETVLEYFVGCWRRHNSIRNTLGKKNYTPQDSQHIHTVLDKLRDIIISYAGLDLQDPGMFTQTQRKPTGPPELVSCLLSLSSLTDPLSSRLSGAILSSYEVPLFLQDLARRFEPDGELASVLGSTVNLLLHHESLLRPEGLGGADAGWRGVISGLEALVSVKPIAVMITQLPEWNPQDATAPDFEFKSLLGPLLRLNVFGKEWATIANAFFSEPEKRTSLDVDSSNANLRGTLKSLQATLFQIFNTLVRASPVSRENVLQYFSRVVSLNVKRGGMQVDPDTVASDGFIINLQTVLLKFAEPFMDAKYSKIDRIDQSYLGRSNRVDVKEETRIKATSDEVAEWEKGLASDSEAPNFITEIFYLTSAVNHYGLNRTIQSFDDLYKQTEEIQRHIDYLTSTMETLPAGNPFIARAQLGLDAAKKELSKVHSEQFAYRVQLLDPEFVLRQVGFTNFLEAWLIRLVDPKKTHPTPTVEIPLPEEIPTIFRMLPEYFLEDIVDFLLFLMRNSPTSFDLTGRNELVIWALTFLRSTWYIKNPFLKAKINEVIFFGTLSFGREQNGVLGNILNTHPFALKHLMPALMSFYIEVEQTGASSQFYDKFNARRNIAHILKAIWDNPTHRKALNEEAKNVDKFVRFANLMINDVTYLMDESLNELAQIASIQKEMDTPEWQSKPLQYRREREGTLRSLERHASGYTTLGRSTVDLLKIFTAETKAPFMVPEIVDRLAAMLDYNLDALAGPRCSTIAVKDREKYRFDPKKLLSDILQIYLNLADQEEFVRAVANDGRSYSKELFERAAGIARLKVLKTEDEIEQIRIFVVKVEEMKANLEAEDDLGDVPDEYLDPLMFTLMRDPVILPSSKVNIDRSTIKSHLLSDNKDPFNRSPLKLEDVIPNPELKAQIEAFIAERRNKPIAVEIPGKDDISMDIDG
ncbi:ubiquitin conjugation factor E4 [Pyrrhoderma noxium]|uniref:RING-type E3 ubiquitin transferase n=1 Tax=Pyrrhoderma noxium TaxID=2282107 RepID=A0A286UCF6_9AGAM|nr:ubiquitin conjugation factor E4 [Pyrrhoderma noxium]